MANKKKIYTFFLIAIFYMNQVKDHLFKHLWDVHCLMAALVKLSMNKHRHIGVLQ